MEELINKLDNWEIFKLLGGAGIVLTGMIIYVSKLINQRLFQSWKENSEERLEEVKGLINKNNSVVTTLTQQIGQNFQKLMINELKLLKYIGIEFSK